MTYSLEIKPELDKKLAKLYKKNRKQYEMILKKAEEIVQNPQHYKNLRAPLQHLKEVHIDKHFVLTFSVDDKLKSVTLEDFEHHDEIFR
jgi:YafQ family addiction module toxin component